MKISLVNIHLCKLGIKNNHETLQYVYIYITRFRLKFAPQNKPEIMCVNHRKYQSKLKEVDIWGVYIYNLLVGFALICLHLLSEVDKDPPVHGFQGEATAAATEAQKQEAIAAA